MWVIVCVFNEKWKFKFVKIFSVIGKIELFFINILLNIILI